MSLRRTERRADLQAALSACILCTLLLLPNLALAHAREVEPGPVTAQRFFSLGVEHILTGFDHLLFLVALMVRRLRLRQVLWLVTSFSLAHSLTLGLVALSVFQVSENIVEPAIAASVVLVAGLTLTGAEHPPRYGLSFLLGLIHGCGFAQALVDVGLPSQARWLGLVAFNFGVEAGQLLVFACVVPLLWAFDRPRVGYAPRAALIVFGFVGAMLLMRDDLLTALLIASLSIGLAIAIPTWGYERVVVRTGSLMIAVLGAVWFTFRVTGYSSYALELSLRRLWL